jgi:hypothetical protein
VYPRRFACASADPGQSAHKFDQRRFDSSGKTLIQLIEGTLADDFAE